MAFSVESFNAMLKARNGKLPVRVIKASDTTESDLDEFVRDARTSYREMYQIDAKRKKHVFLTDVFDENVLVFTTECDETCPHFDITIKKDVKSFVERFVKDLNLYGLTVEWVMSCEGHEKLTKMLMGDQYTTALINTLEAHFASDSDTAFKESDFDWLNGSAESHPDNIVLPEVNVADEEALPEPISVPEPEPEDNHMCESESDVIPRPDGQLDDEEYDDEENNEDELTSEEIAENEELISKIRQAYEECKKTIEGSCNSLYTPIKNRIKEALESDTFTTQLCLMYLEISQDTSTAVYKKIYETDALMKEFNDKVHRRTMKMGCPNCNHQWYEDITFLKKGVHEIHCPKCNTSRLVEI